MLESTGVEKTATKKAAATKPAAAKKEAGKRGAPLTRPPSAGMTRPEPSSGHRC